MLNGSNGSYYSADNGFKCAAAGRGVPEALQEHLNVIVRNEELETGKAASEIQEDINALVEDKEQLEQQKLDRQEYLDAVVKDLTTKEIRFSELEKALQDPLNIDLEADPSTQALQDKIDENTLKLEENTSELASLREERAKIETDLASPTQTELETVPLEEQSVSESTRLEKGFACLTAVIIVGLVVYLFIFYASVGDRTFTAGIGTIAEKQQIIIPRALSEAWTVDDPQNDSKNWFVLTFPFIFLTLAILVYYCHEHNRWWILGGLIAATFAVDTVIAIKISMQMHEFTKGEEVAYVWRENLIEILSVLLLGFGVSLLLSYGLYWFMKVWKGVKPNQDISERVAKLIRAEKNERLIELSALDTRIQNIQDRNSTLNAENQGYQDKIELTFKKPLEIELAGLLADRERGQEQMQDLSGQIESFQREINGCESEIEGLVKRKRNLVDIRKLEAQANEFITGWCRYVAQTQTNSPDVDQIKEIQQIAQKTLESYKADNLQEL